MRRGCCTKFSCFVQQPLCVSLSLKIGAEICRRAQVDVMDGRLRQICIDEEEDADAARETALDGALTRIKEGNEVKARNAAHACRRECRRQILGHAEDRRTDIIGGNIICAQQFTDEFLRRLPDFFFVIAPDRDGASYTTHMLHSLMNAMR